MINFDNKFFEALMIGEDNIVDYFVMMMAMEKEEYYYYLDSMDEAIQQYLYFNA